MGDLVKGYGQYRAGKEAKRAGKLEAEQLHERADVRRAASHRDAAEEQRNAELAYSRALAVTAASGGGVDDPTVVKIFADLQAEGRYRVLSRLFVGEDEAEGIEYRAEVARREGQSRYKSGRLNALSSAASFAETFG